MAAEWTTEKEARKNRKIKGKRDGRQQQRDVYASAYIQSNLTARLDCVEQFHKSFPSYYIIAKRINQVRGSDALSSV
jgi:hypothetical protein